MTKKRSNYLAQLQQRRRGTDSTEPAAKPPSEMSEEELEAEIKRVGRELRNTQETAVTVGREELAARRGNLSDVLRGKSRRRRPWK